MQIEHLRSWHQTRTRADPNTWCAASKPTLTLTSPTLPFTIQFLYIDSENVYRRLLCVTGQIDVVYANFWGLKVTFTHLKPVCSCATALKRKHVSSQNLFGLYSDSQIRKAYESHFSSLQVSSKSLLNAKRAARGLSAGFMCPASSILGASDSGWMAKQQSEQSDPGGSAGGYMSFSAPRCAYIILHLPLAGPT